MSKGVYAVMANFARFRSGGHIGDSAYTALWRSPDHSEWQSSGSEYASPVAAEAAAGRALCAYLNEQTTRRDSIVPEWSGSLDPTDPDNFWIDDVTGERVSAKPNGQQRESD